MNGDRDKAPLGKCTGLLSVSELELEYKINIPIASRPSHFDCKLHGSARFYVLFTRRLYNLSLFRGLRDRLHNITSKYALRLLQN